MLKKNCNYCRKEILKDPIVIEGFSLYSDDELSKREDHYFNYYCSEFCEYSDEIIKHTIFFNYDANHIINHLIKQHNYKIDVLENALNDVKKYLVLRGV
jgi:hypothetical protein